jgi:hypothetical protein
MRFESVNENAGNTGTSLTSSAGKREALMNSRWILLMAALALAVIWVVAPIQAFNPQPDPPGKWGMVGITPYETGRLNVVTNDSTPAQSCTIGLGYLDADGRALKTDFKVLRTGRAQYLDLMGIDAVPRGEMRAEIQPFLNDRLLMDRPTAFPPDPCRGVIATFEVFDPATGKTSLSIPGVPRSAQGNGNN